MGVWLPLSLGLVVVPVGAAWQQGGALDQARETLSKWVETRRLISEERSEWQLDRELLADRVTLLKGELESESELLKEKQAEIEKTATVFNELGQEIAKLEAALGGMGAAIEPLEERLRSLLKGLPRPLAENERFAAVAQRLPSPTGPKTLSLGERYLTVIGVLNEMDKWNAAVHVETEILTLADGSPVEVQTMYLGLAQGYYASRDGRLAGRGSGSAAGWIWTPADGDAAEIARAFAIHSSAEKADFLALPIAIQ
jgi:hypothetical protein